RKVQIPAAETQQDRHRRGDPRRRVGGGSKGRACRVDPWISLDVEMLAPERHGRHPPSSGVFDGYPLPLTVSQSSSRVVTGSEMGRSGCGLQYSKCGALVSIRFTTDPMLWTGRRDSIFTLRNDEPHNTSRPIPPQYMAGAALTGGSAWLAA